SPDGRFLATGDEGGAIRLWDAVTGNERAYLAGHGNAVTALAFSGDGRFLISGSADTTALVWSLRGLDRSIPPPTVALTSAELDTAWSDLAADAEQAYRATWLLTAAGRPILPTLSEHLRPLTTVDTLRLARLIGELDSASFNTRQRASAELAEMGEAATAALREALADRPSAEVRRRVERLLEAIVEGELTGDQLRGLRAVEILEHLGTPEAVRMLEGLGRGPSARLTREAEAAVRRLTRRAPPAA